MAYLKEKIEEYQQGLPIIGQPPLELLEGILQVVEE